MKFLHFTSGVTYRVPIREDGSLGQPEVLKKWTSETYKPRQTKKVVKKKGMVISDNSQEENAW